MTVIQALEKIVVGVVAICGIILIVTGTVLVMSMLCAAIRYYGALY